MFCFLRDFDSQVESRNYFTTIKTKLNYLMSYLEKQEIDYESPSEYRAFMLNNLTKAPESVAEISEFSPPDITRLDYTVDYTLNNYYPSGCIGHEDLFWEEYYNYLISKYTDDYIDEEKRRKKEKEIEETNKKTYFQNAINVVRNILTIYNEKVIGSGGILSIKFQKVLEEMIKLFKVLDTMTYKGMPIFDRDTCNIQIDDLVYDGSKLKIISKFITANRLLPFKPESSLFKVNIQDAIYEDKAKIFNFSRTAHGTEYAQSYVFANNNNKEIIYSPLLKIEPNAPLLTEISPNEYAAEYKAL